MQQNYKYNENTFLNYFLHLKAQSCRLVIMQTTD